MFELAAPVPNFQTTTLLPSPQFGDSESLTDEVKITRSMDGTPFSYIKRKDRQKLQWPFRLTRNKSLELLEFFRAFGAKKIRATDHRNRVWIGNITNNPFEFITDQRGAPALQGWPRGESATITIEFEGTLQ